MLLDLISSILSGYLILAAIWFITLVIVLVRLFNRKDTPLPEKILWGAIIFIAPVLGLVLYLVIGLPKRKKLLDNKKLKINNNTILYNTKYKKKKQQYKET